MFTEYLDQLRYEGKRYFISKRVRHYPKLSDDAARSGLYRLNKEENNPDACKKYLKNSNRPYVALAPYISRTGHPKCEKLKQF